MSDHRYGQDMGLPPLRPLTATDSRPPVPFFALSATESDRRRGGASRTSSGELQTVRAPFQTTRGYRNSTGSAALGTASLMPGRRGPRSLFRARLTGSTSQGRGLTGLAAAAVALALQSRASGEFRTGRPRARSRSLAGSAVHGRGPVRSLSASSATPGIAMRGPASPYRNC